MSNKKGTEHLNSVPFLCFTSAFRRSKKYSPYNMNIINDLYINLDEILVTLNYEREDDGVA